MPSSRSTIQWVGGVLALALFAGTFVFSVFGVAPFGKIGNSRGNGKGSLGPFDDLDCTFTQGFWKNHEESRPDEGTLVLGTVEYNSSEITVLLEMPGSKQHRVVSHLIAALYNIGSGASSPTQVDDTIADLHVGIAGTDLLSTNLETVVSKSTLDTYNEILTDYNEGETGPGKCDDDDDDGCPPCPTVSSSSTGTFECPEVCPDEVACTNALSVCDFQPPKADRVKVEFCNGNDTAFFVRWLPAGTVVNGTVWTVTFDVTRFGTFVETLVNGPFELEYGFQRPIGDFNSSATEFGVEVVASVPGCPGSGPVTKKGPINLLPAFEQLAKVVEGV